MGMIFIIVNLVLVVRISVSKYVGLVITLCQYQVAVVCARVSTLGVLIELEIQSIADLLAHICFL